MERDHGWNLSFKPLFLGYILSMLIVVAGYRIVTKHHIASSMLLDFTLLGFCLLVTIIQLVFFLHLGLEARPNWYLITFLFTALVIVVVIGGSLWIMYNLNYNVMPMEMEGHGAF